MPTDNVVYLNFYPRHNYKLNKIKINKYESIYHAYGNANIKNKWLSNIIISLDLNNNAFKIQSRGYKNSEIFEFFENCLISFHSKCSHCQSYIDIDIPLLSLNNGNTENKPMNFQFRYMEINFILNNCRYAIESFYKKIKVIYTFLIQIICIRKYLSHMLIMIYQIKINFTKKYKP